MYSFKKITVKNIFSFASLEYSFKKEPVLVIGKNLDDLGQEKNGSGKSSFIECMFIAITGNSLRGVTQNDILKRDEDEGFIILELEDESDKGIFEITRTFSSKRSSTCKLRFISNDTNKSVDKVLSSVSEYNKFIMSHLDLTVDDILSFFIITKDKTSFLRGNDTSKKEIISRFSNVDLIKDIKTTIENKSKERLVDFQEYEKQIVKLSTQIDIFQSQLNEFNSRKEELFNSSEERRSFLNTELYKTEEEISKNKNLLIETELEFNSVYVSLENLEKEYDSCLNKAKLFKEEKQNEKLSLENQILKNKEDFNIFSEKIKSRIVEAKNAIKENNSYIEEFHSSKGKLITKIRDFENKLSGKITCPKCNSEFVVDSDLSLEEIESNIKKNKSKIKKIDLEVEETTKENLEIEKIILSYKEKIDKKLSSLEEDERKIKEKISSIFRNEKLEEYTLTLYDSIFDLKERFLKIKIQKNDISNKISEANNRKELLLDQISKINDFSEIDSKILSLDEKIKTLSFEYQEAYDKKNDISLSIEKINEWHPIMKSFKNYLYNKTIKYISEITNSNLKKMKSDLTLDIEGYKETKNGIKEEITISILRRGFYEGNFKKFSSGEKSRIEIANILGIQELVNTNSNKGLNILILDEFLDSCDSYGIENIFNSLKGLNKTIIIVSQVEINSLKHETLTICKENQSSTIL